MIKNLQSLRGIASILIFYHHYGFKGEIIESFGDFGVVFFMMLSGFVLYLSAEKRYASTGETPHFKEFLSRRLAKIYPLYLIFWILAVLVLPYSGSRVGKALGLLCLQSWVPDSAVYFSGNAVGWFVSDLILCYLLFVPVYRLFKVNPMRAYALSGFYIGICLLVAALTPKELVHAIVYINPMMQFANFLIGILLCRLFLAWKENWCGISADLSEFAIAAGIILAMFCCGYVSIRLSYGCYWWPIAAMVIFIFAMQDKSAGVINKLLHSSLFLEIGRLSLVFYLIHFIGISLWERFLLMMGWEAEDVFLQILQSCVLIILLIGSSYLINKYIEAPIGKMLLKTEKN